MDKFKFELTLLLFGIVYAAGFTIRIPEKDIQETEVDSESSDDTRRTFTNSHGYQYIEANPDKDSDKSESSPSFLSSHEESEEFEVESSDESASTQESAEPDENSQIEETESLIEERYTYHEKSNETPEEIDLHIDEDHSINKGSHNNDTSRQKNYDFTVHNENIDDSTTNNNEKYESGHLDANEGIKEHENDQHENVQIDIGLDVNKINDVEKEIDSRNRLFDNVIRIYQNTGQKVLARHKRENRLQPEVSEELTKHEDIDENSNEDIQDYEYIQELLNQVLADIIAGLLADMNCDLDDDEPLQTPTFGMSLTGNGGYVWNDLWSNPGYSFDVGNPPVTTEKPSDPYYNEEILQPYENTDTKISSEGSYKPPILDDGANIQKPNKTFSDIYVNIHEYTNIDEKVKEYVDHNKEKTDKIKIHKNKSKGADEKVQNEDSEHFDDINSDSKKIEDSKKNIGYGKKKGNVSKNIWEDLLQNTEFWKWLEQWISLYKEQSFEYIKMIIRDEVSRQIQNYSDNMYIEGKVENDVLNNKVKNNKKNANKKDKDIDLKTESYKDSNQIGEENFRKIEKNLPQIQDGKITVDGKEIPITINSNFDNNEREKGTKSWKHNKHIKDKDIIKLPIIIDINKMATKPDNVKVETIYGNNVGNNELTNIYIFYSNKELGTLISEFKPNNKINNDKLVDTCNNKEEIKIDPDDMDKNPIGDKSQEQDTSHKINGGSEVAATNNEENYILSNSEHEIIAKETEDSNKLFSQEKIN